MKSVFIGFMAQLGYFLVLGVFWGLALLFLYLAKKLFTRRNHVVASLFVLAAVFAFLVPHWGRFPGRMLADRVCRDIGGVHTTSSVPIKSDGIFFDGVAVNSDGVKGISKLLFEDGFATIEESTDHFNSIPQYIDAPKGMYAYEIQPSDVAKCGYFTELKRKRAGEVIFLYQHGMKYGECLAINKVQTPSSKVRYSQTIERRHFPISLKILRAEYVDLGLNKSISSRTGFDYYESNPYAGKAGYLDCHRKESNRIYDNAGLVMGNNPKRAPPNPVTAAPTLSEFSVTEPISFEEVEHDFFTMDGDQYLGHYENAMDMKAGIRIWMPEIERVSGGVVVSVDNMDEGFSIPLPAFKNPTSYSLAPGHLSGESFVKILAAKKTEDSIILVRSHHEILEVSEYHYAQNHWRRHYLKINQGTEAAPAINRLYGSIHLVATKIEVGADSISMHMLDIRSDHLSKEIIIDTAFNVVVKRP